MQVIQITRLINKVPPRNGESPLLTTNDFDFLPTVPQYHIGAQKTKAFQRHRKLELVPEQLSHKIEGILMIHMTVHRVCMYVFTTNTHRPIHFKLVYGGPIVL